MRGIRGGGGRRERRGAAPRPRVVLANSQPTRQRQAKQRKASAGRRDSGAVNGLREAGAWTLTRTSAASSLVGVDGELTVGNVVCGGDGGVRQWLPSLPLPLPPCRLRLPLSLSSSERKGKGQFAVNSDPSETVCLSVGLRDWTDVTGGGEEEQGASAATT